ncbi:MAG: 2-amino-4-hydroxy-6-hydroxymethyldihydropteridine diphosphokinase [Spirochaetales bacterium]|nr:2-amino-4-hydroxy-6-hydroxymethyldihydropteridine diphosphokinase [Spirochaetales bacterium]
MPGELVYLGVGSNLGNREEAILNAQRQIETILTDFRRSSIYETAPMYREDQPKFLNCVFRGLSSIDPMEVLVRLRDIEHNAGRDRHSAGWMGPRPLDVDILLYGERIIHTDELVVPHPRMHERAFVLVPLIELDPQLRDPRTGVKYADLAVRLGREGIYFYKD